MLSDLQTRKLTRYFRVYDVDDDGRIDAADFERVVENVRVLHGESERSSAYRELRAAYLDRWESLGASVDGKSDGGIDLDGWLAYWQDALEDDRRYEAEVESINDRLFSVFDLDEDDVIGSAEFADFYGVFGLRVELADRVFSALDTDGDGRITRAELREATRQFYRGDDADEPGSMLFGPVGR